MPHLNRPQRVVLMAAAVVVGLGTLSIVAGEGFRGVSWIAGVLLTAALLLAATSSNQASKAPANDVDRNGAKQASTLESPATRLDNGTTFEKAWVIEASNSAEGIRKEYQIMSRLFGRHNADWSVVSRSLKEDGIKSVDHFILSTKSGRREIYFDVSGFIRKNRSHADVFGVERDDPIFSRKVSITLIKSTFYELEKFVGDVSRDDHYVIYISKIQLDEIKKSFEEKRLLNDGSGFAIELQQLTAINLAVLLELIAKSTQDLRVQDWIENCTGAVKSALGSRSAK